MRLRGLPQTMKDILDKRMYGLRPLMAIMNFFKLDKTWRIKYLSGNTGGAVYESKSFPYALLPYGEALYVKIKANRLISNHYSVSIYLYIFSQSPYYVTITHCGCITFDSFYIFHVS